MHGVRGRGAPLNTPHSASSSGPTCETVRDCSARGITFRASMSVWTSPQPILSSTGAGGTHLPVRISSSGYPPRPVQVFRQSQRALEVSRRIYRYARKTKMGSIVN
jgi:hypothetical protein